MYCLKKIKRVRLIDGSEEELEKTHFYTTEGGQQIAISVDSFIGSPFSKLKTQLTEANFGSLLHQLNAKKGMGIIESYTTDTGLELYFLPNAPSENPTSLLFIVSFGEVGPGHFQLTVEAALERI